MKEQFKTVSGQINISLPHYFEDLLFRTMEHMQYISKAKTFKHGLLEFALAYQIIDQVEYDHAFKYELNRREDK